MRCAPSLVRLGSALTLAVVLAGCTPGGQFDPTTMFDNDMFNTKKKVSGDREPLFPNGVPGTSTGVPPDLVKGYQPPPDQAADNGAAAAAAPPSPEPPKPKPKPKPKLARARAPKQDSAFDQKPPTRINIGLAPKSGAPAQQGGGGSQSPWPAPTQNASTQPSQSPWPAPPGQQTAQPSQSIWPNPPAPNTSTQ